MRLSEHLPADASLATSRAMNPMAQAMRGSLILGIAGDVREMVAAGAQVCNLTVGDFDARQFPIPRPLRDATVAAIDGAQTNYPPAEGLPELRKAVARWYGDNLGLDVGPDWVIIASGARPVMYSTYRLVLEPGDDLVYAVPSWNNSYYAELCGAREVPVVTRVEDNFFPTAAMLEAPLSRARLFTLNSPLNPTGTVIDPAQLADIARLVVDENRRRTREGRPALMWMWDQVYWQLTFGAARHAHPAQLVPEVAPWVITIDAISKAFAATGLRVGWAVLPPYLAERMKAFIGHVGAWAPRPEQVATAAWLGDRAGMASFLEGFRAGLSERLELLHRGLGRLDVEHLNPQGALYLSVRFPLFGRPGVDGRPMATNEDVRRWLLARAGIAVVPFQAFDLASDTGWFRMSVGAVTPASLEAGLARLGDALGA